MKSADNLEIIVKNTQQPGQDFFYNYKKMSISSSNLYKCGKNNEQLREDKAVQIYF